MIPTVAPRPAAAFNHGSAYVLFGSMMGAQRVRWWWRPFRRPGFEHCFAILPMAQGSVLVNGLAHGMVVEWSGFAAGDCVLALRQQWPQMRCLVVLDRATDGVYAPFEPMTCVTVVKGLLGIRAPIVVSPKGLHDLLLRRGAERL